MRTLLAAVAVILVLTGATPKKNLVRMTPGAPVVNFTVTVTTPPLDDIPPYLGPEDKIRSPEAFVAAFLPTNETFRFAREHQRTHYAYVGYIEPRDMVRANDTFVWPDSLALFAYTRTGKIRVDYVLGHTECLAGETPVKGFYYAGGKIFWIYPNGRPGAPAPFTNFMVRSRNPRCRIVVLLPREVPAKKITGWGIELVPRSSRGGGPQ